MAAVIADPSLVQLVFIFRLWVTSIESEKFVMSMEFYSSLMKSLPDLAELEVILARCIWCDTGYHDHCKRMTSGTVPMGGVLVKEEIYDTFMTGPRMRLSFFTVIPTQDILWLQQQDWQHSRFMKKKGLFENARKVGASWKKRSIKSKERNM